MINLMYLVLLAMLALNVSTDVLEGFSLVADGLKKSTENASKVNMGIYSTFDQQMKNNPAKVKEWYEKAQYVRGMSDSLYNLAEAQSGHRTCCQVQAATKYIKCFAWSTRIDSDCS